MLLIKRNVRKGEMALKRFYVSLSFFKNLERVGLDGQLMEQDESEKNKGRLWNKRIGWRIK